MSVPNRILLRYPLRVSEFCYAMVRKHTKMSKNVGLYLSRRGVHFYLGRLSQMVTRGGMQLTSNRTRATT